MIHKKISLLLMMTISLAVNAQQSQTLNLMPVPKTMNLQRGTFQLNSNFSIAIHTKKPDAILLKAANRFYQTIGSKTALGVSQEYLKFNDNNPEASLQVHVDNTLLPAIGVDESYNLSVSSKQIVLKAPTTAGALHGLQTLVQLVEKKGVEFAIPNLIINDAPRFQWRGLMIDVSRHFMPIDVIERNIDAMATVKMNVLHLHLTDDQGFRIESKIFPKLHSEGSNGDYYSQTQISDLIDYARDRGIEIVPEFDMPGHTKSWFAGHPELASAPGPYEPGSPMNMSDLLGKDGNFSLDAFYSKTLTDVLEPVKGYKKLFTWLTKPASTTNQTAPLAEVSDFIPVDAETKWKFRAAVTSYLQQKDKASEKIINNYLMRWKNNDDMLAGICDNATALQQVKEHSRQLALLAGIGLQAMEQVKAAKSPSDKWIKNSSVVIKNAGEVHGETSIAIVDEIASLVKRQMVSLPASFPIY